MNFSQHRAVKNEDGTFSILDVPVFELGEHKGFAYDAAWATEAINNFNTLKEKGRLPRVIVGHTAEGVEKKALGFWDNLRLIGNMFVTDLIKIKEKVFEEIKNQEWPGRSVEVNPDKKKFTALALLGGSEPYFESLEPLELIFEDSGGQWVELEHQKKEPGMAEKTFTEEQHTAILEAAQKGFSEQFVAEFKLKHGVTPEEALAQAKAHEAQIRKFADDVRQERIAAFCDKLKKENVAPALVDAFARVRPQLNDADAIAKFDEAGENLSAGAYFDKFFETLIGYAKEGKLLVPQGDSGQKTVQSFAEGGAENSEAEKRKYFQENSKTFSKLGITEADFLKYGR